MNKRIIKMLPYRTIILILVAIFLLTGLLIKGQEVRQVAAQTNPILPGCDILPECEYIRQHIYDPIPETTTVLSKRTSQKLIPVTGQICAAHLGEPLSERLYIGMGYSLVNRQCGVQEAYVGVKNNHQRNP